MDVVDGLERVREGSRDGGSEAPRAALTRRDAAKCPVAALSPKSNFFEMELRGIPFNLFMIFLKVLLVEGEEDGCC